jgi:uncharacterized protein YndB with AHSA1/START domain
VRPVIVLAVFVALAQCFAAAEVADSGDGGFTIKSTVNLKASPADVYRKVLKVGDWWSSDHTYSGDSHNLTIEERPGGCWCEKMPGAAGVKHMEVVFLLPGQLLRFTGGLGPLQEMAIVGSMTFKLSAEGGGTKLEYVCRRRIFSSRAGRSCRAC